MRLKKAILDRMRRVSSEEFQYRPPNGAPDIVYVDADVLVVDKASGLLSVPGRALHHRDSLSLRIQALFPQALVVHRLDMDTSGLMIFALHKKAQANLSRMFQMREVHKIYEARVNGIFVEESGSVDLPLIIDWERRPLKKVCFDTGKSALTHWRVLQREEGVTRVELKPHTGRSHQLRMHMKEIGHPILGDLFYAPHDVQDAAPRLQLHARSLALHHPCEEKWLELLAPVPF